MKITKRQLRQIIKEAVGDDFFSDREANPHDGSMYGDPEGGYEPVRSKSKSWIGIKTYLELGDTASATNAVLNLFWMDDTWRQEEDALEDILGALPYTATTKEIQAASEGWLADYREGKFRPQTKEDMEADWARGAQPRIK